MNKIYSLRTKITLTVLAVLLSIITGFAQTRVSGTVKDVNGETLPGVTVIVPNTQTGAVTNVDGVYEINLPANADRLVFSYMGYSTETVTVGRRTVIDVVLKESTTELEELVVVGYGTMRKSDLTGSVGSVRINENEASSVSTFDKLLQGSVAGVRVTSGGGAPGGQTNITIRGSSSFHSASEPLFVVDGIILNPSTQDVGNFMGSSGGHDGQSTLSTINPKDILSMEILKDASATAIYGSQGANGVVLITTKTGVTGKPRIEYSTNLSVSKASKRIPMLDVYGYAQWRNEIYDMQGSASYRIDPDTVKAMDWQDYSMRQPLSQTHKISVSGKTESTTYFLSGNFSDNNGIVKNTGVKTGNLRLNLDKTLHPSSCCYPSPRWLRPLASSCLPCRKTNSGYLP
jgi:TonB-linked SusC/RagA family outer membrane protein